MKFTKKFFVFFLFFFLLPKIVFAGDCRCTGETTGRGTTSLGACCWGCAQPSLTGVWQNVFWDGTEKSCDCVLQETLVGRFETSVEGTGVMTNPEFLSSLNKCCEAFGGKPVKWRGEDELCACKCPATNEYQSAITLGDCCGACGVSEGGDVSWNTDLLRPSHTTTECRANCECADGSKKMSGQPAECCVACSSHEEIKYEGADFDCACKAKGRVFTAATTPEECCRTAARELGENINDLEITILGINLPCSPADALPPPSPSTTAPAPYTFSATPPRLSIPIPTLPSLTTFMSVEPQGEPGNRYLFIPWIGEYIAAMYKYAIGITGVLAGIMIVIAGLIWLTAGGDSGKISTAKSYIEGAMVGLVIALTSYVLLYAVNPELTGFESLKIKFVERVDFVQNELLTTTVDTTGDGGRGGGGGGGGEVSGTVTGWQGTCPDSFPDCPIILNEPCAAGSGVGPNNPRAKEFLEKIKGILGGETARQKVLKIADAATKCGVVLGSCGKTVEQINGVAGISGKGPRRKGLRDNNLLCAINCNSPGKTCQNLLDSHAQCGQAPGAPKRKKAFEKIRGGNPGYPDEWTKLLEPGDAFDMYAVNSGVGGQHAVIFVGWEADGKKARVIEGASGKLVKYGSWCIRSTCPNPTPVTYIYNAGP